MNTVICHVSYWRIEVEVKSEKKSLFYLPSIRRIAASAASLRLQAISPMRGFEHCEHTPARVLAASFASSAATCALRFCSTSAAVASTASASSFALVSFLRVAERRPNKINHKRQTGF
jgi:hypothetical protein